MTTKRIIKTRKKVPRKKVTPEARKELLAFWENKVGKTRICAVCKQEKPLDTFSLAENRIGSQCDECAYYVGRYCWMDRHQSEDETKAMIRQKYYEINALKSYLSTLSPEYQSLSLKERVEIFRKGIESFVPPVEDKTS